jgi:hypothetical protein
MLLMLTPLTHIYITNIIRYDGKNANGHEVHPLHNTTQTLIMHALLAQMMIAIFFHKFSSAFVKFSLPHECECVD